MSCCWRACQLLKILVAASRNIIAGIHSTAAFGFLVAQVETWNGFPRLVPPQTSTRDEVHGYVKLDLGLGGLKLINLLVLRGFGSP